MQTNPMTQTNYGKHEQCEEVKHGTKEPNNIEHIFCNNSLTYEEILNWRGFSFEQSTSIAKHPLGSMTALQTEVENGTYGIEESERIIANVLSKKKGY